MCVTEYTCSYAETAEMIPKDNENVFPVPTYCRIFPSASGDLY